MECEENQKNVRNIYTQNNVNPIATTYYLMGNCFTINKGSSIVVFLRQNFGPVLQRGVVV